MRRALERQGHQLLETNSHGRGQFSEPYSRSVESDPVQRDWNKFAIKRGMVGEHYTTTPQQMERNGKDTVDDEDKKRFYNPYNERSASPKTVPLATLHMLYRAGIF